MQTYKTYAKIESAGRLVLTGVPFAEGSLVEVLLVDPTRSPAEREAGWAALMRHVQALPQAQTLSDQDIAAEIDACRNQHDRAG